MKQKLEVSAFEKCNWDEYEEFLEKRSKEELEER